jgi:glutathione S-transferase
MYTLYFSPGSCSLVIHCLLEGPRPFVLKRVHLDAGEHRGADYGRINPKGKVPALATPEGVLTECVALIGYLCDAYDDGRMLARHGSWQRSKTMEQVATLATEVHPLFNRYFHEDDFSDSKDVRAAVKARGAEKLLAYFREQDALLTRPFWSGDEMTVADLYFMTIARWGRWLDPPATR